MMLLLDTHVLVWAVLSSSRLSSAASQYIADDSSTILVSAASAWELATKVRLGRFPQAEAFENQFLEVVRAAGYTLLPIEAEAALRAGRLVADHGDPFDRMIAAQALQLDIPVISADPKFDLFGIRRIW
jgi:PIN domain nuclease of toxin-antitoxin system